MTDIQGLKNKKSHLQHPLEEYGLNYVTAKSEIRVFLSCDVLIEKIKDSGDNWWHGFQHGIGIISHAAPIAYLMGQKKIYFISTY